MKPSITNVEIERAERRYAELIHKIREYTVADTNKLRKAFDTAMELHKCRRRKGGAPYITHPLEVAHFCADMKRDNKVITAALLHDVVEDEGTSIKEITDLFGPDVACLVEAVTNLDNSLEKYESMEKKDLDILSDGKLIEQVSRNPQALYIKVGDRVHNLGDMKSMSYPKVVAKTRHTQDILIPLLRIARATRLIEILENLCFKVDNAKAYNQIKQSYDNLRASNSLSYKWMQDYLCSVIYNFSENYYIQDGLLPIPEGGLPDSKWIRAIPFYRRYSVSICRDIDEKIENLFDGFPNVITKKNVALYDVYFVTNKDCPLSPAAMFFSYYPLLHAGVYIPKEKGFKDVRFMLTVIGQGKDKVTNLPFFLLQDAFGTGYRFFLETEEDFTDHIHGCIYKQDDKRMPKVNVIDSAEPSASFERSIHVFLRDGKPKRMPAGSTVLDLAFKIHREVGLCAKYAYLNDRDAAIPLHTKLMDGDRVNIITDADKDNPEKNVIHATIRWFEHVRTREATRELSRFFEKNIEAGRTRTRIFVDETEAMEIPTGCTVLDFAFILGRETGLHFSRAFINNSHRPCGKDYVLSYDDRVRIETDEAVRPEIGWLKIVRMPESREVLVDYFEKILNGAED